MTPKLLLRIAAVLSLLFAAGHSVGHATRFDTSNPMQAAVLKGMESVEFDVGSQKRTYAEMYTGMSLILVFTAAALAVLFWVLAGAAPRQPETVRAALWPLLPLLAALAYASFRYFFVVPGATNALAAVAVALALLRLRRA